MTIQAALSKLASKNKFQDTVLKFKQSINVLKRELSQVILSKTQD
jgi:hypothetical protein